MNIKTLNRTESAVAMKEWLSDYPNMPQVDDSYKKMREDIQKMNEKIRINSESVSDKKDYYIDVHLGILLYDYLWNMPGFNMRAAANEDFWRYLSVKVVPDVVAQRWGKDNESHYWSKPTRIWLRSIWWYIHLSWQGDIQNTAHVLESECFSTDTILNLEERTGRKGTYINVYRYIMYYYSRIPQNVIDAYNKRLPNKQDTLLRVIMRLNTAKVMVIDPALYLGGENEYVKSLYRDAGVEL